LWEWKGEANSDAVTFSSGAGIAGLGALLIALPTFNGCCLALRVILNLGRRFGLRH
jgi:hypothetical protein